jgi:hypothetical protein
MTRIHSSIAPASMKFAASSTSASSTSANDDTRVIGLLRSAPAIVPGIRTPSTGVKRTVRVAVPSSLFTVCTLSHSSGETNVSIPRTVRVTLFGHLTSEARNTRLWSRDHRADSWFVHPSTSVRRVWPSARIRVSARTAPSTSVTMRTAGPSATMHSNSSSSAPLACQQPKNGCQSRLRNVVWAPATWALAARKVRTSAGCNTRLFMKPPESWKLAVSLTCSDVREFQPHRGRLSFVVQSTCWNAIKPLNYGHDLSATAHRGTRTG